MADPYNVSIRLSMIDGVTRSINDIHKKLGKVVSAVGHWDNKLVKISETFGLMSANSFNAQKHVGQLADEMERLASAYSSIPKKGSFALPKMSGNTVGNITTKVDSYANSVRGTANQPFTIDTLKQQAKMLAQLESVGANLGGKTSIDMLNFYQKSLRHVGELSVDAYNKSLRDLGKDLEGSLDLRGRDPLKGYASKINATKNQYFGHSDLKSVTNTLKELDKLDLSTMSQTQILNKYAQELGKVEKSVDSVNSSIGNKLNKSLKENKSITSDATNGLDVFTSSLKRLAGGYLSLQGLNKVIDISDSLTLTQGKLRQLTDDVEGFMDKAYQMSQETRTSYLDNASQMAKMWQLTGGKEGVFESEDKLMRFNELLNKSFTLGGSGTREINASMYQLTQALSSGRLQGDELRSLGENASYFVNVLTDYIEKSYNAGKPLEDQIELTYNDLKRLGAEGVLTSDLIVNAFLQSGEAIDEAFSNVDVTFDQMFQTLKNQLTKLAQPILNKLNEIANSEAFGKMIQLMAQLFTVAMGLLDPILDAVMWLGEIVADNWSKIAPVIWTIVGAMAVYLAILMVTKTWTWLCATAEALHSAYLTAKTVALGLAEVALMHYKNGTILATIATMGLGTKILIVIGILAAIVGVIYLVVKAVLSATDSTLSALGIVVGGFSVFFAFLYNGFTVVWNLIVGIVEILPNLFTDPVYAVAELFTDLFQGIIDCAIAIVSPIDSVVTSVVNAVVDGLNWAFNKIEKVVNWGSDFLNAIGFNVGTVDWGNIEYTSSVAGALKDLNTSIEGWREKNKPDDYKSLDSWKLDTIDLGDAYNWGYDKGVGIENKIGDIVDMIKGGELLDFKAEDLDTSGYDISSEYLDSLPDPNVNGSYPDSGLPQDVINAIKDTAENTEIAKDDLKYLRDIAEQKVVNRFTTAEIKVTTNMNNNINGEQDLDGIADYFQKVLEKAVNSTAEKTNGRAVI